MNIKGKILILLHVGVCATIFQTSAFLEENALRNFAAYYHKSYTVQWISFTELHAVEKTSHFNQSSN